MLAFILPLVAAVLFAVLAFVYRGRFILGRVLSGLSAGCILFAVGPLVIPESLAGYFVVGSLITFLILVSALFLSSAWSSWLALGVAAAFALSLGAWGSNSLAAEVSEFARSLVDLRLKSPWWLLLLLFVPVVIYLGRRRLNRQEARPWWVLGLRVAGISLLALALAEPFFSQASRMMTVIFVVDRSASIPEELDDDPAQPGVKIDQRNKRILKFLNDAVARRGAGHERDKAGLVIFGRQPRLELPPSDAPQFNLKELPSADDANYTNLASALKLALASFPEGSARRIVLVSDGNENLGSAEEQAELAKSLGVQVDVLPLATRRKNLDEVLVERVDAPAIIEQGARLPIRVLVRSHSPEVVVGKLILRQITDKDGTLGLRLDKMGSVGLEVEPNPAGKGVRITKVVRGSSADRAGLEPAEEVLQIDGEEVQGPGGFEVLLARKKPGEEARLTMKRNPVKIIATQDGVRLRFGLNPFTFDRPLTDEQRSYTYEAEFQPLLVENEKGEILRKGLPGDRVQNNRASTHVVARGKGRILVLENKAGDHKELAERLAEAGKGARFQIVAEPVDILDNYKERDKLAVFLSNFDCVILANVPAERISEEHQEILRSNTHDQGCGLVMVGGPDSFGAGGWQKTPIEKALPVDCDIKSLKVQGKGGLVMLMHASEMARGNYWQKIIGKLAVERLGPNDEVGVLVYDFNVKWHIKMQEVGPNRADILAKIDALSPGDMPDFDPALKMGYDALTDKTKEFGAKHMIIISDGDPVQSNKALLQQMKDEKITIATVGVATHGAPEDIKMADIASEIKGTTKKRYYKVTDPKQLPAIYIKESRLVSQAFVYRKAFMPRLVYRSGPTARLPDLPELGGFVRTTPKPSPLVEVPIVSPMFAEQEFPILAYWHYGLGKSVAFTSDAGQPEFWSRKWAGGAGRDGVFAGFWEQVLGWVLRPVESGRLVMNTEYRDGKIRVVVEAKTPDGKSDTNLKLRGGLTQPPNRGGDGKPLELRFTQKNSGQYEAEVKAEEAGSYFLNAQATRVRKVLLPGEKEEREIEEGTDSVRAGVTLPYSPEYADLESNTPLLERLRTATNGERYEDDADSLEETTKNGTVFREPIKRSRSALPFHYWLLLFAAFLLLCDVAVRRLAFNSEETTEALRIIWLRLRGKPLPPPMEKNATGRLRARVATAEVSDKAARRFEGSGTVVATKDEPKASKPSPTSKPSGVPEPMAENKVEDALDILSKAKKKAWDDRESK